MQRFCSTYYIKNRAHIFTNSTLFQSSSYAINVIISLQYTFQVFLLLTLELGVRFGCVWDLQTNHRLKLPLETLLCKSTSLKTLYNSWTAFWIWEGRVFWWLWNGFVQVLPQVLARSALKVCETAAWVKGGVWPCSGASSYRVWTFCLFHARSKFDQIPHSNTFWGGERKVFSTGKDYSIIDNSCSFNASTVSATK